MGKNFKTKKIEKNENDSMNKNENIHVLTLKHRQASAWNHTRILRNMHESSKFL